MQRFFSPHWYYAESCEAFQKDLKKEKGKYIQRFLEHSQDHNGDTRFEKEVQNWPESLRGLKRLIQGAGLDANQIAILEYRFNTKQRIDALLCGQNRKGEDTAFLIELKNWYQNGENFNLESVEGNLEKISLKVNGEKSEKRLHPSVQVNRYREKIGNLLEGAFEFDPENVRLQSAVYFYGMEDMTEEWRGVLFDPKFKPETKKSKMYLRWNEHELFERLEDNLSYGSGVSTMQKLAYVNS